jgi:hypothetical protein
MCIKINTSEMASLTMDRKSTQTGALIAFVSFFLLMVISIMFSVGYNSSAHTGCISVTYANGHKQLRIPIEKAISGEAQRWRTTCDLIQGPGSDENQPLEAATGPMLCRKLAVLFRAKTEDYYLEANGGYPTKCLTGPGTCLVDICVLKVEDGGYEGLSGEYELPPNCLRKGDSFRGCQGTCEICEMNGAEISAWIFAGLAALSVAAYFYAAPRTTGGKSAKA